MGKVAISHGEPINFYCRNKSILFHTLLFGSVILLLNSCSDEPYSEDIVGVWATKEIQVIHLIPILAPDNFPKIAKFWIEFRDDKTFTLRSAFTKSPDEVFNSKRHAQTSGKWEYSYSQNSSFTMEITELGDSSFASTPHLLFDKGKISGIECSVRSETIGDSNPVFFTKLY